MLRLPFLTFGCVKTFTDQKSLEPYSNVPPNHAQLDTWCRQGRAAIEAAIRTQRGAHHAPCGSPEGAGDPRRTSPSMVFADLKACMVRGSASISVAIATRLERHSATPRKH